MPYTVHSSAVFAPVTPSDTVGAPPMSRLYVGGAGTVVLKGVDGVLATFSAVPVGTVLPVSPAYIMAATSATLLIAMG